MPFVSKSQFHKFYFLYKRGKISKEEFKKWIKETGSIKNLPEHVKGKKK